MIDSYKSEYPELNNENCCILDNSMVIYDCHKTKTGISGYVIDDNQNHIRAFYNIKRESWYFGNENIRKNNLINLSERTESEKLAIIAKSNESKRANIERKKTMNDIAKAMLDTALSSKQAQKLLNVEELPEYLEDSTVSALIIAKGIQSAIVDGSFKWAEFVRDTAGYKPKNEVELSADIMTDADRALLDKLEKRTSN